MTDLQSRNAAFSTFLDTLNPAQRRAVEQTEGPVLVVAGPGTGKTQVLTTRIGNILLRTDARAQNLLCLTFTDAGANAMRQRLLQRIGPEAHRVPIFTFHAFCNRVIQENLEYFGKGKLEPLTELERIELIRKMLLKLSPEHPLRSGKKEVFQHEKQLQDLFALLKKEGWTPGWVIRKADEFLQGLPGNPDFIYQRNGKLARKGEPKTALVQEVTEKMERLKAAADLYPKYQQALERAGRYEYEDMLLWVNRAFEKNEALLRSWQERCQYVLVDEFQDTNGAQFQLLNLLLNFWDKPNIFIVGDDDQSVYEFQGARLRNLREFYEKYHNGLEIIVLQENYRSTQNILDAAGRLIGRNQLRAVALFEQPVEKRLRAQNAPPDAPGPLRRRYPTRLHELSDVLAQIEALLQSGVPASEIAVLYARHQQAEPLLALLGKKGIPHQTKRPQNILDLPLIGQLRSLLQYIDEEGQRPFAGEFRLFALLHAAFWGLRASDLARIAAHMARSARQPDDGERYLQAGRNERQAPRWRETLADRAVLEGLRCADPTGLHRVGALLDAWVADRHNLPLPQLLERMATQSGLLPWALQQPDKLAHVQALYSFFEFVRGEAARTPRFDLSRLLALLDSMDDNKLALPLRQAAQEGPAVQLLTAHAAKGLEFDHVFMIDCTEDAWERNVGGSRGRFALPPTLTLSGEEDALEARRRLFYVAMTRARKGLYLSCAAASDEGKPLQGSVFAEEAELPVEERSAHPDALLQTQSLLLLEAAAPVVTLPEASVLDALLADFRLSISAFNRYLRCPLAFYYEDLLKVPGHSSEAAAFGLAMHAALQQFLLAMKADKKQQWPSPERLQRLFGAEMERQRPYFSERNFAQRLALGADYLRRIHVEQVPFWRKRAIVERRLDRVELEGVPLTGVLDKIEWLDSGQLRVVDYKTGLPDPKKTAPPDEKQPYGGEYWRQLAFYQLLLDHAHVFPETVGKTAISWLEPDRRGAFPITELQFSAADLRQMTQWVIAVHQKIQARDFATGCGKPDCSWCAMQRQRPVQEWPERSDAELALDD
jgi:DNA helicase-2/ATP-dependent DNA helicase PcrA